MSSHSPHSFHPQKPSRMSLACVCLYMYVYYLENFFFFTTKHFPFSRRDADDMAARAPFSSASGQIAEVSLSLSWYFFFGLSFFFNIYVPRPASCLDGGCWCVSDPCRVRVLAVNMWESLFASDLFFFFVSFFPRPYVFQMTFEAVLLLFLNCNV